MPFAQNLKRLRLERGILRQQDLAERIGIRRSTIANWEAGHKVPNRRSLEQLARFFGVNASDLLDSQPEGADAQAHAKELARLLKRRQQIIELLASPLDESRADLFRHLATIEERTKELRFRLANASAPPEGAPCRVPLLGFVHAGHPDYAQQDEQGSVEVAASLRADFALSVRGDSMVGAGIFEGDIAICRSVQHRQPKHRDIVVALIGQTEATLKILEQDRDGWWLRPANPKYPTLPLQPLTDTIQGVVVRIEKSPDVAVRAALDSWIEQSS